MVILFLGPSGSGKDTQAELLIKFIPDSIVLSTGAILREAVKLGSPDAEEISNCLKEGKWVPDEIVYRTVTYSLKNINASNIFFTGAVRTKEQVPLFDESLAQVGKKLDIVFNLDISDEEAIRRLLSRNREDDTIELIKNRLEEYHTNQDPIIEIYKDRGILEVINGERSISEIQEEIRNFLQKKHEST